jgi:hypothetical protein
MNRSYILVLSATSILGLAMAGCPRGDDPIVLAGGAAAAEQRAPVAVEAAPTAATPIAEAPAAKAVEPAVEGAQPPKMVRRAVVTSVQVVRVEAERAEDGSGAMIAAKAPVAIEIAAEAWPVRALDPVLHVGNLEFRHYTFPRVNVLQYVVADAALLPAGAAAWIQYGDDVASRVEVAQSLEVPR